MVTRRESERRWSRFAAPLLGGAAGVAVAACGFSEAPPASSTTGNATTNATGTTSTGGPATTTTGSTGAGGATGTGSTTDTGSTTTGGPATTTTGGPATTGNGGAGGNAGATTGTTGTAGNGGTGGITGTGGNGGSLPTSFANYELSGTFPTLESVVATKPGKLTYQKITINTRFLAESCSIADYNKDGVPDVSAGRRWYEGPAFTASHIFRGGHDDLPRNGDAPEIVSGVADDWSDFPWDIDGDGWTDIINIASSDANTAVMPMPRPQQNATGYWYKNPGAGLAGDPMWAGTLIHGDIRQEQHGIADVDGDGKPEIFGACKNCNPPQTKGYYQANWANPSAAWTYHPVTSMYTFPFGGTGWLHGLGFGDVNGDGKPDLLERGGAWLQQANGTWNANVCPGAGCGWVKTTLYDGNTGDNRGGSHMYSFDVDGDGDADIISADWAHGWGLAWYEQTAPMQFTKHPFMGSNSAADLAKFGPVIFSEPHSLQVADMDGDGIPDIITGKERFAHPLSENDPDALGTPFLYVFKTIRNKPSVAGSVTFEPHMVDNVAGVGRQLAVGHVNTDGIMDICVSTKLGLFVFLGQP